MTLLTRMSKTDETTLLDRIFYWSLFVVCLGFGLILAITTRKFPKQTK